MSEMMWKCGPEGQDVAPRSRRNPYPVDLHEYPREEVVRKRAGANHVPAQAQKRQEVRGVGTESVRPAVQAGPGEAALRKVLWGLIAAMALVLAGELVFQLAIAPGLMVNRLDFDLDPAINADGVRTLLGLENPVPYYACDPEVLAETLETLPVVASAKVERIFPDTLAIHARARVPLVVTRVSGTMGDGAWQEGPGQTPMSVDVAGRVYAPAGEEEANLPVLSGIDFRNFRPGLELPVPVRDFLQDLDRIRNERPDIYQAFSEFRLVPVSAKVVEVLVYTMASPVPVRINNRINADNALYILRTMNLLATQPLGREVVEVDFRTRNLILRKGGKQ